MADTPLRADFVRANPIARRALLGALAAAPIAASSIAMAANTGSPDGVLDMNMFASIRRNDRADAWEDPAIASRRIDAAFWEARDEMRTIECLWKFDLANYPDKAMPDERCDEWGERHNEAERKMMMAKITTIPALWAKLDAIKAGEMDAHQGDNDYPAPIDLVLWDIERMMKAAYRVPKNG